MVGGKYVGTSLRRRRRSHTRSSSCGRSRSRSRSGGSSTSLMYLFSVELNDHDLVLLHSVLLNMLCFVYAHVPMCPCAHVPYAMIFPLAVFQSCIRCAKTFAGPLFPLTAFTPAIFQICSFHQHVFAPPVFQKW